MMKKADFSSYPDSLDFLPMIPPNNLDLQGNFQNFPPAEIFTEIRQSRLDGSLRLAHGEQKTIVYFRGGKVIFVVSNARSSRLYEVLLREQKLNKKWLAEFPGFANDQQFADFLIEKNYLPPEAINSLFTYQQEFALREILGWTSGEWTFSPLVRLREGIDYNLDLNRLLIEYARQTAPLSAVKRIFGAGEMFLVAEQNPSVQLSPPEAFVFSRFGTDILTLDQIKSIGGLGDEIIVQTLYVLWLGGLLARRNWNAAFPAKKIEEIKAAKISLVKEVAKPQTIQTAPPETVKESVVETIQEEKPVQEVQISVEEYLENNKKAADFYELLGIESTSPDADIKTAYFNLAKRFHPDHFFKDSDPTLHSRVQTAFTQLAQAYETLKSQDNREVYNFKIRKELAHREKMRDASREEIVQQQQTDFALENFEQGFSFLMDEHYEKALPHLARAAHLSPETPRYHAYYGKVLSAAESQRHKAENELQTAIKLDGENVTFRIMLVEFFIQYKLYKRAEGELNRLLTKFPDHKEARQLLDSLAKK